MSNHLVSSSEEVGCILCPINLGVKLRSFHQSHLKPHSHVSDANRVNFTEDMWSWVCGQSHGVHHIVLKLCQLPHGALTSSTVHWGVSSGPSLTSCLSVFSYPLHSLTSACLPLCDLLGQMVIYFCGYAGS